MATELKYCGLCLHNSTNYEHSGLKQYGCFESFPFRQKLFNFVCQTTWFWWNVRHWTSGVNVHNEHSNRLSAVLTLLNFFFTFSVKDRYQLNDFICIKDFNAQIITSVKLNLFYFFIYCCQHHERKTTCLDIRQTVRYQTQVFQPFSRRLHIRDITIITYNLPHLRLWYVNVVTVYSVNTGSSLPNISDVMTWKRRNVIGIDMIRNNRIIKLPQLY